MQKQKGGKLFFITVILLAAVGFVVFWSASLGLLSRAGANFETIVFKQLTVLGLGLALFGLVSRVPYLKWGRVSTFLFLLSLVLATLVFVPGLGLETGGARRWLDLGPISFQPAELLKLTFVLFLASWMARARSDIKTFSRGLLPFLAIVGLTSTTLVFQPDIDKVFLILAVGTVMFFIAGGRWRHLLLIFLLGVILFGALLLAKPYLVTRIQTFFDPSQNTLSTSYQINQSLIAIGSGGITGRGFGKSIQKFYHLPEPINDSIFAVASEEFGFFGGIILLFLFVVFALSGFKIAARAPTLFGRLVATGLTIMIVMEALMNIASMLGLVPLSGTPLLFVSQGGTALLFALGASGIVLNIARHH